MSRTNEELAVAIRSGESELLPQLWGQVEKFVAMLAGRWLRAFNGQCGVELGDLMGSGYLALVEAANSFDPESGCSFVGWLALRIKTQFAAAYGVRSKKRDPLLSAVSLDAPLKQSDGSDAEETLGDLIEDKRNADVETAIWREQLHEVLAAGLAELPEVQRAIIEDYFFKGKPLVQIAGEHGKRAQVIQAWKGKGLNNLRRVRGIREFARSIDLLTDFYHGNAEQIAIHRENLRERAAKSRPSWMSDELIAYHRQVEELLNPPAE